MRRTTVGPIGGFSDETACVNPNDCQSRTLVNGVCKGNALIGDPCAGSFELRRGDVLSQRALRPVVRISQIR